MISLVLSSQQQILRVFFLACLCCILVVTHNVYSFKITSSLSLSLSSSLPSSPSSSFSNGSLFLTIARGGDQQQQEQNGNTSNNNNDPIETTNDNNDDDNNNNTIEILEEKTVYSGWRTIVQRKVRMRNGTIVNFDLVGVKTGGGAVLVFAWDTKTKTVTLVREYMPGSNKMMWGLAAGLVESGKHGHDSMVAARHELEEECHLEGGTWIPLCKSPSSMDKYALTDIEAYLVIDPNPVVDNPRPLDDEEDIEIVNGVTIPEIMEYITTGNMNIVSGWGCLLAIAKLQELGEV